MISYSSQALNFPDSHTEELCFNLYQVSLCPLIFGHPWLSNQNPHFDSATGSVINGGSNSEQHGLFKENGTGTPVAAQNAPVTPEIPSSGVTGNPI